MKNKRYRAFWENGNASGEFEYTSEYRNNSANNMRDCLRHMNSLYNGSKRITDTYLV